MKSELRHYIERTLMAIWIFAAAGGFYVIVNASVHPETLTIQLSHLTPWIREDTFGIISWIVSFVSFLMWNILRD